MATLTVTEATPSAAATTPPYSLALYTAQVLGSKT